MDHGPACGWTVSGCIRCSAPASRSSNRCLTSILSRATLAELKNSASLAEEQFFYCDELWVKTVYEFADSYHRSVISRDHIIQALAPLYRGRVFTFLMQNAEAAAAEVEQHIEDLCLTFERMKPYLLELWQGKEGGS